MIDKITKNIRGLYKSILNRGRKIYIDKPRKHGQASEIVYEDTIEHFEISNTRESYFSDQQVNIVIETNATRDVNAKAKIGLFMNGKEERYANIVNHNGRIQYQLNDLRPGKYEVEADLYKEQEVYLQTKLYEFEVIDEVAPSDRKENVVKDPDIEIIQVKGKEEIISVFHDEDTGAIKIYLCLDHKLLNEALNSSSAERLIHLKNTIMEPLVLYVLFLQEEYTSIVESDKKNKIITAFINTLTSTGYIK